MVLGLGKTAEQIAAIVAELARTGANVLATRVDDGARRRRCCAAVPAARHEQLARAIVVEQQPIADVGRGTVLVVSAGTSDLPVAEEAALTARLVGNRVERLVDVGVAGMHRLLGEPRDARGGERDRGGGGHGGRAAVGGGGAASRPVIAVPTSVGYGASFGGMAALLGMLN